jgi:RNA polymerase sigma factor (sigma-70 family)
MPADPSNTLELLARWHAGDLGALEPLIALHLPWIRRYASARMGQDLRAFESSEDVVQHALTSFLQHGPAFVPENEAQFRGLIARVVLNRLHDLRDYAMAAKRDRARERSLPSSGISRIGAFAPSGDGPMRAAEDNEMRGFVAIAMQLIEPDERHLIRLREWEGREFADIGRELGISRDAARMRFNQAIARLGKQVKRLHSGALDELVAEASAY